MWTEPFNYRAHPAILSKETRPITWKFKKKALDILAKEQGTVIKDPGGKLRVALVYPNTYNLGMSNLALHAIYSLLNSLDHVVVERLFLPEKEDIGEFKRTGTELFTLETQTPLTKFDIVAFSTSFEEDYLNIPVILTLARIPVFSSERGETDPLVMVGGAAVSLNPEPIADFMDLVIVGDGEGPILEVIERFSEEGRDAPPTAYSSITGVYVPSLYEITYDGAIIKEISPKNGAPAKVKAAKASDLDDFPMPKTAIVTPDTEFANTVLMEIEKGCGRHCRFCAAGFLYLPPRWRDFEKVKETMMVSLKEFGKVGLVGAAVSEYPRLKELLKAGVELGGEITLSSIRMEMIDPELLSLLKKCGYKTVTVAPEAGTDRMRHVINKCMGEAEILDACRMIDEAGFERLKLYFLAGLPTETDEEVMGIAGLTARIRGVFKKGSITVSINPFIPKPVTPFQTHPFERIEVLEKRFKAVKKALLGIKGTKVNIFSPREAFYQALIARGDRRLAPIIKDAALLYGGSLKRSLKAHKETFPSVDVCLYRERNEDEIFPWDMIDHGLDKEYLYKEYKKGLSATETGPCIVGKCTRCRVC